MILDLRLPSIVIAGAFNPAIFVPNWIANVLYDVPEGQDIEGVFLVDEAQKSVRPYISEIAVVAEPHRLTVFIDNMSAATVTKAEQIILRIAQTLPHTPVGGIGINFRVIEPEPSPELIELISPADHPDRIGVVSKSTISSTIDKPDGTKIGLSREIENAEAAFSFNFHADVAGFASIPYDVNGMIFRYLAEAKQVLTSLYGIEAGELEVRRALNKLGDPNV